MQCNVTHSCQIIQLNCILKQPLLFCFNCYEPNDVNIGSKLVQISRLRDTQMSHMYQCRERQQYFSRIVW